MSNNTWSRDYSLFGDNTANQDNELNNYLDLKRSIFRELKVGTLAKVMTVNKLQEYVIVNPFPLLSDETNKNIKCVGCLFKTIDKITQKEDSYDISYKYTNIIEDLKEGDIVCVIFMDRNFNNSLNQIKKSNNYSLLNRKDDNFHLDSYGIIIKLIYRGVK